MTDVLPVRVRPLARAAVEAAIYDLTLPDPLAAPIEPASGEPSPLLARLRRIEEKLDLLLGAAAIDAPRPLSGRDRRSVTFSGNGLSVDVELEFRRGDAFRIELLLPVPHARLVRAVGESVADACDAEVRSGSGALRRLALAFRHIESADRDALVAYSYDVQRQALRAKRDEAAARP